MDTNINNQNETMNQTSKGGLVVMVTTAGGTMPIRNAHVTVSRRNGKDEELLRTLTTNANGRTPIIELPAPSKSNSLSPDESNPFSVYTIRVDYPGYYAMENVDVPIFPGIIALQPVNLIPLPLDIFNGKQKNFHENAASTLISEEESGGNQ